MYSCVCVFGRARVSLPRQPHIRPNGRRVVELYCCRSQSVAPQQQQQHQSRSVHVVVVTTIAEQHRSWRRRCRHVGQASGGRNWPDAGEDTRRPTRVQGCHPRRRRCRKIWYVLFVQVYGWVCTHRLTTVVRSAVTLQFVSHSFLDYHDPTIGELANGHKLDQYQYQMFAQRIRINSRRSSTARPHCWTFWTRPARWNSPPCGINTCAAARDSSFAIR